MTIPSYTPRANGMVERYNRTFLGMLSAFVGLGHHDDWDVYIRVLAGAYNMSVHSSTRDTPFYLAYGVDPITPVEADCLAFHMRLNMNLILNLSANNIMTLSHKHAL